MDSLCLWPERTKISRAWVERVGPLVEAPLVVEDGAELAEGAALALEVLVGATNLQGLVQELLGLGQPALIVGHDGQVAQRLALHAAQTRLTGQGQGVLQRAASLVVLVGPREALAPPQHRVRLHVEQPGFPRHGGRLAREVALGRVLAVQERPARLRNEQLRPPPWIVELGELGRHGFEVDLFRGPVTQPVQHGLAVAEHVEPQPRGRQRVRWQAPCPAAPPRRHWRTPGRRGAPP